MTSIDPAAGRQYVRQALLTPSPLWRYLPGSARTARHAGIGLVAPGPPGRDFNFVLVFEPAPLRRVLDLAEPFFGTRSGFTVVLEAGTAGALGDELLATGWCLVEGETALVLPALPTHVPTMPAGLEIRRVDSPRGLSDFEAVQGAPSAFLPSVAAARDPAVAALVGYCGHQPVATSRVVCLGAIAEITGVVTRPEFRRRGYGLSLTWAALAAAQARGCHVAVLSATAMGYPLYSRMGFVPVATYRTYVRVDPA